VSSSAPPSPSSSSAASSCSPCTSSALALADAWQYRPGFRRATPWLVVALAIAAVITAAAYID
jgi:hypothetical protein